MAKSDTFATHVLQVFGNRLQDIVIYINFVSIYIL